MLLDCMIGERCRVSTAAKSVRWMNSRSLGQKHQRRRSVSCGVELRSYSFGWLHHPRLGGPDGASSTAGEGAGGAGGGGVGAGATGCT